MREFFWLLVVLMTFGMLNACSLEQPQNECTPGAKVCEESIFYECMRDGKSWESVVCNSNNKLGAFCNVAHTCVACNDDENCQSAEKHCVDHVCEPLSVKACVEGSKKCTLGKAYTCLKKAWEDEEICPNGCNPSGTACFPLEACTRNETKCEGDSVTTCSVDGEWGTAVDCTLTSQVCDNAKGCVECKDNDHCKDPIKPVCNANMKTCQSIDAKCANGETKCNDDVLYTCNATQSDFEETPCAATTPHCDNDKACVECKNNDDCKDPTKPVCNANMKACEAADALCAKNETRCDGNTFLTCNLAQSGFDKKACAASTPICDVIEGCVQCRKSSDCKDPLPVCNADTNTCRAADAVCNIGEKKCEGNAFMKCNAKQSGFDTTLCSGSKPVCDVIEGCVECRKSSDCKDALKPVCNADTNTCRAADAVCIKDETKCVGNIFMKCNAALNGFDNIICDPKSSTPACDAKKGCVECKTNVDCTNPAKPVCNTTTMTCQICTSGTTKCMGSAHWTCTAQTGFISVSCDPKGPAPYCEAKGCVECKASTDCKDPSYSFCKKGTNSCQSLDGTCLVSEKRCVGHVFSQCLVGRWSELDCSKLLKVCDADKGCIARSPAYRHDFDNCTFTGPYMGGECLQDKSATLVFEVGKRPDIADSLYGKSLLLEASGFAEVKARNGVGKISLMVKKLDNTSQNFNMTIGGKTVMNGVGMTEGSTVYFYEYPANISGSVVITINAGQATVIDELDWTNYP